jgi:hypothetical protein
MATLANVFRWCTPVHSDVLKTLLKLIPYLIGAVFFVSAAFKLVIPKEAKFALEAIGVPESLSGGAIMAMCAIEFFIGMNLLLLNRTTAYLRISTCLLFAFTAFLLFLIAFRPQVKSCGCTGLEHVINIDGMAPSVVRNLVMIGLSGLYLWATAVERRRGHL